MNYFSLFDLSESVEINADDLHVRYIKLQQTTHPDRFVSATEEEKLKALQLSSQVNDAYQTLSRTVPRLRHLLEIQNVYIDDAKTNQDMSFLMQQMQLREQLEITQSDLDHDQLEELINDNEQQLAQALKNFDQYYQAKKFDLCVAVLQQIQFFDKFQQELIRVKKRITHQTNR